MVKDSLKVLSGTFIANACGIIRLYIISKALTPERYGIWNLLMLIPAYVLILDFGVLTGMDKTVPTFRGQSRNEEIEAVKSTTFTALFILAVLFSIILFLISFVGNNIFESMTIIGLRLLSIVVFCSVLQNFYLTVLRAEKEFGLISKANSAFAISSVLYLILLYSTPFNKFYTTIISIIFAYVTSLLICIFFSAYKFMWMLDYKILKKLIKIGLPLVFTGINFLLLTSIDRWIIAKYLSKVELGNYALGATFASLLFMLSSVFGYVIYPRILEKYGQCSDEKKLESYILRATMVLTSIVGIACCMIVQLLPFIYDTFFPLYKGGQFAASFIITGMFFLSITTIMGNYLIAVNKQSRIILFQIIFIASGIVGYYFVTSLIGNIQSVAIVTAILFFLYGSTIVIYSLITLGCPYNKIIKTLFEFISTIVIGFISIFLFKFANKLIFNFSDSHESLIGALILMVIYILYFVASDKRRLIFIDLKKSFLSGT